MTYTLTYSKRGNVIRREYDNLLTLAKAYRRIRNVTLATWRVI